MTGSPATTLPSARLVDLLASAGAVADDRLLLARPAYIERQQQRY